MRAAYITNGFVYQKVSSQKARDSLLENHKDKNWRAITLKEIKQKGMLEGVVIRKLLKKPS